MSVLVNRVSKPPPLSALSVKEPFVSDVSILGSCSIFLRSSTSPPASSQSLDIQSDIRPLSQNERKVLFEHLTACGAIKNGDYWDFTAVDPEALLKVEEIKAPAVNLAERALNSHAGTWKKDADGTWRFSQVQSCFGDEVSYDSSGHLQSLLHLLFQQETRQLRQFIVETPIPQRAPDPSPRR